jgi:hypothetical protein
MWSFGNDPQGSDLDAVRLLVWDTNSEDQLLDDSSILYYLARNPDNVNCAAADTAEAIAAKFARMQLAEVGDLAKNLQAKAKNYFILAESLRRRADRTALSGIGPSTLSGLLDKDSAFYLGVCYGPRSTIAEDTEEVVTMYPPGYLSTVYTDGTTVYARDKAGNLLDSGAYQVDDSRVIAAALTYAGANKNDAPAATVWIQAGYYFLTETLRVYGGINLWQDGWLMHNITDKSQFTVVFYDYAMAQRVIVNANNGAGIQIGNESSFPSSAWFGWVKCINAGNSYDSLTIRGYNVSIDHVETVGGRYGIYMNGCADIFIKSGIIINAKQTGIYSNYCEHCTINAIDLDSCDGVALKFVGTHDFDIGAMLCWYNGYVYTGSTDYAIDLGYRVGGITEVVDKCVGIRIRGGIHGAATTAVRLYNVEDSMLDLTITNRTIFTPTQTIVTAYSFGTDVGEEVILKGTIGDGIAFTTGTVKGVLDVAMWGKRYTHGQELELWNNILPKGDNGTGGTATILSGATGVVVTHNWGSAPAANRIQLTPLGSEVVDCWVSGVNATQFTIQRSAAVTGNRDIGWRIY